MKELIDKITKDEKVKERLTTAFRNVKEKGILDIYDFRQISECRVRIHTAIWYTFKFNSVDTAIRNKEITYDRMCNALINYYNI